MKCYLKIKEKIEGLSNYDKINKTFEISNDIIENGFDHLYKFNKIEYLIDTGGSENKRIAFDIIKSQRKNHTRTFKVHDLKTNKDKIIRVYSALNELKSMELNFKSNSVGKYVITLSKDRTKL